MFCEGFPTDFRIRRDFTPITLGEILFIYGDFYEALCMLKQERLLLKLSRLDYQQATMGTYPRTSRSSGVLIYFSFYFEICKAIQQNKGPASFHELEASFWAESCFRSSLRPLKPIFNLGSGTLKWS